MKKYKKLLIILVSLGSLLVVGANIYAEIIWCGQFTFGCVIGGCRDAQAAADCVLIDCMNIPGENLKCEYPPQH